MPDSKAPCDPHALHNENVAEPEAPKVPLVLDPDDPAGLLPLRALGQDLEVTYMGWDFTTIPGRTDLVELGFTPFGSAFVKVNERAYPVPINVPWPQTLTIPKDLLNQGVYEVSIRVSPSLQNPTEFPRKKITIDTTKPNFGNTPESVIFPTELNGIISESYLTQHGQVIVEVPFYFDVTAGDRAVYYWTDKEDPPDSETEIREQEFSAQDIVDKRLLITVYADEIRQWGGGDRYMYYRLRDRAGNTGPNAKLGKIYVDLTPLPGVLPPPRVPLSRNLLDRQQAREGVRVEIDPYEFPDASHHVAVDWDGTPVDEFPVDPANFPLKITVPWSVLHTRGDGPMRPRVSYRIRMAGSGYTQPSPDISVALDLTIAGQDHPNAPALLNETLAKLEIRGQKSDQPNKIMGIDFGLPAKVLLTLYDHPKTLEEIDVYWGQIIDPVAHYQVKSSDKAGDLIELEIPWVYIEPELQNPKLPVYYVTRNGVNEQNSLVTEVAVSIIVITDLKEPSFPHGGKHGVLHCCSTPRLWEGVTVHIPCHVSFTAKDQVVIYWQGCRGLNGSDPIAGADADFTITLSEEDAENGFDWVVSDYENLIAPMVNNGSALVYYILIKQDGSVGKSVPEFVIINRTLPSGEVCSPTHEADCP